MGPSRTFDHEQILTLYSQMLTPTEVARRTGMAHGSVCNVLRAACDRGDPRAARYRKRPKIVPGSQPPAHRPPVDDRPNVTTIHVVTMGRNDGLARKLPVSLPRLSILRDWHGPAATETGGREE